MKNTIKRRFNMQFYPKNIYILSFFLVYFSALPSFALNNFTEIAKFQEIKDLPEERSSHQCVFVNTRLYCIGGLDKNDNVTNSVFYADVQKDKTLGEWKEYKNPFPKAIATQQCFRVNDYIYSIGGKIGNNNTDEIWYSEIQSGNSIGEWKKSTIILPLSLSAHKCCTTNGYIYCTGGYDNSKSKSNIWLTQSSDNGEIEEWKSLQEGLPISLFGHQCIALNGYIYLIGGYRRESDNEYLNSVWYTKIQPDGTLDTWTSTKELPKRIVGLGCFTTNNNLFCTGGGGASGEINDIWYAQWGENKKIKNWVSTENKLLKAIYGHQIKALDSFIYSCGGKPPCTKKTYLSFILPYLKTHPNKDYWYITDKLELNLASEYELGYYYVIDDSPDTEVKIGNNIQASNETLLPITTDTAIEHGTHYLHFALADIADFPKTTYHFKYNNFKTQLDVSSETHPNENAFYTSSICKIKINNLEDGINIRYVVDDKANTIPGTTSKPLYRDELKDDSFV